MAPELEGHEIPDGWFVPVGDHAAGLEAQLAIEVRPGNPAHGHALTAVLKCDHNDDVLFLERTNDGPVFWLVHLTWATPVEPAWPMAVRIYYPDDLIEEVRS